MNKEIKKRSSYIVKVKLKNFSYCSGSVKASFSFLTYDDTVVGETELNTGGGYVLSEEAKKALFIAFEIVEKDISSIIFGEELNKKQEKPKTLTDKRLDKIIEEG